MRFLSPPDSPSGIEDDVGAAPATSEVSEAQSHYTRQRSEWQRRFAGPPSSASSSLPASSAFVAGGSLHSMSTQNKVVVLPPSLSAASAASAAAASPSAAAPPTPSTPATGVLQSASGRPGAAAAVTSSSAAALVAKAFGRAGGNAKFVAAAEVAEKAAQAVAAGRSEVGLAPDAKVAGKPVQSFSHIKVMKEGTCLEVLCLPVLFQKVAPRDRLVIGRGEQADIHTDHPSCSRLHAEIRRTAAAGTARCTYTLRDLGSGHGTLLNGGKIAAGKETELEDEDEVQFGFSQRLYIFFGGRESLDDSACPPAVSPTAAPGLTPSGGGDSAFGPKPRGPNFEPPTGSSATCNSQRSPWTGSAPPQPGPPAVPPPPPDDFFPSHAKGGFSPTSRQSWGRSPVGADRVGPAGSQFGGVSGWDSDASASSNSGFAAPDGMRQREVQTAWRGGECGNGFQCNSGEWSEADTRFQSAGWGGGWNSSAYETAAGPQTPGYGGQQGRWAGQGAENYYDSGSPGFSWGGSNSGVCTPGGESYGEGPMNSGVYTPGGESYGQGDSRGSAPRVSGYASFSPWSLGSGQGGEECSSSYTFEEAGKSHLYTPFAEDSRGNEAWGTANGVSPEKGSRSFAEPRLDMAARKKLWQNRTEKKVDTQRELQEHKERVIKEHSERVLQEKQTLLLQKQKLVEKRRRNQVEEASAAAAKRARGGDTETSESEATKAADSGASDEPGAAEKISRERSRGSSSESSLETVNELRNGQETKETDEEGESDERKNAVYCSHILLKFKRRKEDGEWTRKSRSSKNVNAGSEDIARGGLPVTRTRADAFSMLESVRQIVEEDNTQFGEIAAELSDCPSSRKRGLLGWLSPESEEGQSEKSDTETKGYSLPVEVVQAALQLPVGAISHVVESENGVHLLYRIK
ncbi:PPIC-type PPIASE domain-containing protein [Toxoplasma gondii GAB2-2007-GAL-DOM2]|uniref:PPIC-type PPIASE domain-containing protein n=6 Tax=Toxoplasma gondii TaxID=5811 RepID=S7W5V7_TOXGG|nr:PPIC-type PPIASE domain-containing protein [Toxoplasma gondii GT1]KAF4640810.1 PPIC-type PPIASE domain-containing protein [Toxoplasma gondii]KFG45001.1 PPIC-type PPIASE domain-containing protein [Toxoplasma gondii GAB2-2007-GAL-DOM2]KFG52113.1 PPIC-type PPIASE domain-containing protein [Toxoplasma gondii FOU]PUA90970.1 PPIC-type PPIASE domain-containing protein [Toxoplasma gondii TgCATBr9]RQX74342.1 PPIC-type PPIASE domain-containing protein [Toxoplasma gondii CAST]